MDLPFGKRLYDASVIRKFNGIASMKFITSVLLLAMLTIALELLPSNRVKMSAPRPFEVKISSDKTGSEAIAVPALIAPTKPLIPKQRWTQENSRPITVISFTNEIGIPPGAEAKAVLLTGATNGLIKAKLIEPLKVDGVTILDSGDLMIGHGRSTEERLYIEFKKVVFRDGKSKPVSAQAYDASDSILGLKGSRVGDLTLKLAASSGLNFLSGMAVGLQTPSYDGVAQASGEQGKALMEDVKNRQPIIEVKSGTEFSVTFDGGTNE